MPFQVEFTELAIKKFKKLDKGVQNQIVRKLRVVAKNPKRNVSLLRSIKAFKIRVEDYRLIVDIDWVKEVIYVLTLGHRSTIYHK